jgi:hypothetical protein
VGQGQDRDFEKKEGRWKDNRSNRRERCNWW